MYSRDCYNYCKYRQKSRLAGKMRGVGRGPTATGQGSSLTGSVYNNSLIFSSFGTSYSEDGPRVSPFVQPIGLFESAQSFSELSRCPGQSSTQRHTV
jgi:hypothetical protein